MSALLGGVLTGLASGFINNLFAQKSMGDQVDAQKSLLNYQWNKFGSPVAQAQAMAAAGFNPAQAMSSGGISTQQPNSAAPTAPVYSTGLENIADIGNYLKAIADAKKAGVDTMVAEEDVKLKQIQQQRDSYENYLRQKFGLTQVATELALAYENLSLAKQQGDINEIEKAIKEWTKQKEKAISESEGHRRDILKKELDNTDKRLQLQNRESEARGTASYASANASNAAAEQSRTQADVNRENRRLQSALADIEEGAKIDKLQSLISQYEKDGAISEADAAEARIRASRLRDVEDKRDSKFFKAFDDYSEWLKSKLKIFSK